MTATFGPQGMRANKACSINFPGLYRQNKVPAWQRLHQNHDGLRQWQKVGQHTAHSGGREGKGREEKRRDRMMWERIMRARMERV